MKTHGMEEIIGKTIKGVIIKKRNINFGTPRSQVFLIFTDDTWMEFYSMEGFIIPVSGLFPDGLEGAEKYLSEVMKIEAEVFQDDMGRIIVKTNY